MTTAQPGTYELYDGRIRRGSVTHKATKFVAFDDDGRKLGSFVARQEAIDAINSKAKTKGRLH